jgi:hypothetical protein
MGEWNWSMALPAPLEEIEENVRAMDLSRILDEGRSGGD